MLFSRNSIILLIGEKCHHKNNIYSLKLPQEEPEKIALSALKTNNKVDQST